MAVLKIKISLDSDAFADGNAGNEVARILRRYADEVERDSVYMLPCDLALAFPLRDLNGAKVGQIMVTDDPYDDV